MSEPRFVYYTRNRPPAPGAIPGGGLVYAEQYPERQYVFEIDGMAWGVCVYNRQLAPWEVMRYELISQPIE